MFSGFFDLPWWGYVLVLLGLTHITIASVTIFLHRHQAHRALDLHPIPSHFFRFWLWMTTGMVTKEWAAIHRKHHAKCETAEDPHSPQILGINRVLWGGVFLYVKESRNKDTMERYGHGTPDDWMERHIYTPGQKVGIVLMLAIDIALFGVVPGVLMWGVQMIWIPFWAAGVINGLGHFWGYRNYDCTDASTNLVPWGILIGGEELHNNHHSFATSAKLSSKWYEFDIGWMYIRIMEMLGLAKVKKTIPQPKFAEAKKVVDLEMLQAIVTHRYDVMRRYATSLKTVYGEELAKLAQQHQGKLDMKQLRRWLVSERTEGFPAKLQQQFEKAVADSPRLQQLVAMKQELTAIWARSSASRDQLVKQLQDWCARAEASGIRQLEEFSLRLRSYAV
ncbi:acyl-CoA desaturase [Niveibacterium umoris]|uniref:Stearoyl-CoA desaturase (Delta-9 desaturase) n=1 Tax=Niveibacterium umoris TaxID=1193620 RepID=A0A840BI13_9RHOO|nr:fatty acid desaturase [Niveibacterium umoris]MBB4011239.1 stearoyl-CoA desaturase (delta-9 desaturase) [Niveibacterium umoris]